MDTQYTGLLQHGFDNHNAIQIESGIIIASELPSLDIIHGTLLCELGLAQCLAQWMLNSYCGRKERKEEGTKGRLNSRALALEQRSMVK